MTTNEDERTQAVERCEQCGKEIVPRDADETMRTPHLWCWDCATGNAWSQCREDGVWTDDWHSWEDDGPYCRKHADIKSSGCDCSRCAPDLYVV